MADEINNAPAVRNKTELEVSVRLVEGLQARNSMCLVDLCNEYSRDIYVENLDSRFGRHILDAKSIMQTMMLCALSGNRLRFYIEGADEETDRLKCALEKMLGCKYGGEMLDVRMNYSIEE